MLQLDKESTLLITITQTGGVNLCRHFDLDLVAFFHDLDLVNKGNVAGSFFALPVKNLDVVGVPLHDVADKRRIKLEESMEGCHAQRVNVPLKQARLDLIENIARKNINGLKQPT